MGRGRKPLLPQEKVEQIVRATQKDTPPGYTHWSCRTMVLTGAVIGQCLPRHRHEELLKFLTTIDRATPKGLDVHLILDNYSTHKHANVAAWLVKHPRFHLHFTPPSSSWLNLVERWFRDLTDKALRRGVFHSVPDLIVAIQTYLSANNADPKPFIWTTSPDTIPAKVRRGPVALNQNAS